MKSKIRFSLLLSIVLHVVLVFGLFSRADQSGREAEGLIVELVSLDQRASAAILAGDPTGSSDLLPPEPAFPMGSDENFDLMEENAPPPPDLPLIENEGKVAPPFGQEEDETALPEEPPPPFDPDFPPQEGIEEPLPEQAKSEPALRRVGEIDPSNGSGGAVSGEGAGHGSPGGSAPQPTVADGFPGGLGGAGGGEGGPRFVIPKAGRSNPKPRYPEGARAEGREGTILLRVTVLSTGKVGEAMIEHSSGHPDLDRSAVEAVTKWTFLPARRGGNPVTSSVRIPVTFALERP